MKSSSNVVPLAAPSIEYEDIEAIVKGIAPVFREFVEKSISPVIAKLDALERRLNEMLPPEPGKPGRDGKDVDMDLVINRVFDRLTEFEETALSSLDGTMRAAVKEAVSEIEIPTPKNGKDGKDGVSIAGHVINRSGEWVITHSDGSMFNVGRIVGKQGIQGPAGRDADVEDVRKLVRVEVANEFIDVKKELAGLRDGFRAEVPAIVSESVAERFAQIPPPKNGENGKDGKDADLNEIRGIIKSEVSSEVQTVVAALPPADPGPPGEPGKDADPAIIASMVREQVSAVVAAFEPIKGDPGEPGINGRDADMGAILTHVDAQIAEKVAAIEVLKGDPGSPGEPGRDGKDADMEEVSRQLKENFGEFEKWASGCIDEVIDTKIKAEMSRVEIPIPKDGKDGRDGRDADMDAAFARIDEQISEKVAAIEIPKGEPGEPGKDADMAAAFARIDEQVNGAVAAFPRPADGHTPTVEEMAPIIEKAVSERLGAIKSVGSVMVSRSGELIATYTDGSIHAVGQVCGRDGKDVDLAELSEMVRKEVANIPAPKGKDGTSVHISEIDAIIQKKFDNIQIPRDGRDGKDGRDGVDGKDGQDAFGIDDFSMEYDGDRCLTLKFARGDLSKKETIKFPIAIYRGAYKDGQSYKANDMVSWAGSIWFATKDPAGHPRDHENSGWKLAVKAGRDGKDGEQGKRGDPGRPGRDLTMIGEGGPLDPKRNG
jgi:hypothetical protein